MQPISSEAMKAPTSEPMPPTTATTKTIDPTAAAIDGSVTNALPPITPASPASAQPPPNTSMKTRGTLWPSASTMSGCVSAAWMTSPMRVRVSSRKMPTSISSDTSIMKARYFGKDEVNSVNSGPSSASGTRYGTAGRPHTSFTPSSIR